MPRRWLQGGGNRRRCFAFAGSSPARTSSDRGRRGRCRAGNIRAHQQCEKSRVGPGSSLYAREEYDSHNAEYDAWQPRCQVRRDHPLSANSLCQLNEHEENDRRGEAEANAVCSAAALIAGRERRAEKQNDDARNGNRKLEHSLHAQLVHFGSRSFHRCDETSKLTKSHVGGSFLGEGQLLRRFRELSVDERIDAESDVLS